MWRALFLSVGLTLILLGVECLFVEQFAIKRLVGKKKPAPQQVQASPYQNTSYQIPSYQVSNQTAVTKPQSEYIMFKPKEWMPWSLMAAGAVIVIYTFSLPGRNNREE